MAMPTVSEGRCSGSCGLYPPCRRWKRIGGIGSSRDACWRTAVIVFTSVRPGLADQTEDRNDCHEDVWSRWSLRRGVRGTANRTDRAVGLRTAADLHGKDSVISFARSHAEGPAERIHVADQRGADSWPGRGLSQPSVQAFSSCLVCRRNQQGRGSDLTRRPVTLSGCRSWSALLEV